MRDVQFSIEGSVANAITDSLLLAFVIRPIIEGDEPKDFYNLVENALHDAAKIAFESTYRNETADIAERISVADFIAGGDHIFASTSFTEYRFSARSESSRRNLGAAVASFAASAGEQGIPLAYAFFPTAAGLTDHCPNAKVAVAVPESLIKALRLEWAAVDCAARHGMKLDVYRPASTGISYEDRFVTIGDFSGGEDPCEVDSTSLLDLPRRVIFATGRARPGFIGDILRDGVGQRLIGGTMTVVGGHTVSCWIGKEIEGDELEEDMRRNCPEAMVVGRRIPGHVGIIKNNQGDGWLTWTVPDNAGRFLALLNMLEEAVSAVFGSAAIVDYVYAASRVLAPSRCAGKIQLRILSDTSGDFESMLADTQKTMLQSEAWKRLAGPLLTTHEAHLSLEPREPGGEPWEALIPVIRE